MNRTQSGIRAPAPLADTNRSFYASHWSRLRSVSAWTLIVAPVWALFANPISLWRTLHNCLALRRGAWEAYTGFSSSTAFLKTFYSVQADNLQRHGRKGSSPTMCDGAFPLGTLWYQSALAATLQRRLGWPVVALIGGSVWLGAHAVWSVEGTFAARRLAVIGLAAISANFFGNIFGRQNYNLLGWCWLPVMAWSALNGSHLVFGVTLLAATTASITAAVVGIGTGIVVCAMRGDWLILLAALPAAFACTYRFFAFAPRVESSKMKPLAELSRIIGLSRKSAYRRPIRFGYVAPTAIFFGSFPAAVYLTGWGYGRFSAAELALLSSLPILWFVLNQSHLFRFADLQSVMIVYLTVSAAITLAVPSVAAIALFWLTNSNPLIGLMMFEFDLPWAEMLRHAPVAEPFDMRPVLAAMARLLAPVAAGERVWLAFADPGQSYNKIFDGHSTLYQPLYLCADEHGILALPDWYTVQRYNESDAPPLWGREPETVRRNMSSWGASFALVYVRGDEYTEREWEANGFRVTSRLSWSILRDAAPHTPLVPPEGLEWWLVRDVVAPV